jgi:NADH dehydrogenase
LVLPGDPLCARLDGLVSDVQEGDVRDPASLRPACAGVDTVFHLAAVILARDLDQYDQINRRGTANLAAAAAAAGVRHFVYVSSASVVYPVLTPYGRSKLDAEHIVQAETRFAHTIVRPTLVYDATGAQEFMLFRRFLLRFPVVPFVGSGRARKRPVFSDDVVDGLARIAGNDRALGRTYNLSGGETITLAELARLVLALEGRRRPLMPLPVWFCRALAAVLGRVMRDPPLTPYAIAGFINHADLDPALAMAELGYRPRGVRAGLTACFTPLASIAGAQATNRAIRPAQGSTT